MTFSTQSDAKETKLWRLIFLISNVSGNASNILLGTIVNLSFILLGINYHDGSNVTILTWSENQVKDNITQNCLERHQNAENIVPFNRRRSFLEIIHTLLGVSLFWRVQIQLAVASEYTEGLIKYMYNCVKKTIGIIRYMEFLKLHTTSPTVN